MVYEVHHNDLTQALAAEVAVLDFNATWCNPCRMLAPVLEQVSEELAGKALFCGIDVDQNPALAAQFGITGDSFPAVSMVSLGPMPSRTRNPRPIWPLTVPPMVTEALDTRVTTARIGCIPFVIHKTWGVLIGVRPIGRGETAMGMAGQMRPPFSF